MARHDAVELGQGLDLINDDAAHVRSGVRCLLRQLENALAQLSARRFELAAHVGAHLLQLVQNLGEALRRLRQHDVRLLARLLVDAVHGLAQARPLLLGAAADCLEILPDRFDAAGRRVRSQPRDFARPFARAFERLIEHTGKAGKPLFEISGFAVEGGHQLLQRGAALGERALGLPVAAIDQRHRICQRVGVHVEVAGKPAQIVERLRRHFLEARNVALHVAVGGAGLLRDVVHCRDEIGHPRNQRALDAAHVLVRAAQDLLQENIGLAQALVERIRIGMQHVVRLFDLGNSDRCRLLGLLHRAMGRVLQLLERAADGLGRAFGRHLRAFAQLLDRTIDRFAGRLGGGDVARLQVLERLIDRTGRGMADQARDLFAAVRHRLGEVEALGLDRLDGLIGHAAYFAHEFLALAGERGQQTTRLLVDYSRHLGGTLADRSRNLFRLADEVARHLGAYGKQRAFHFTGILLENIADASRHAADHALGVVRARADRVCSIGRELRERPLRLAAVGLDRLGELTDPSIKRTGG